MRSKHDCALRPPPNDPTGRALRPVFFDRLDDCFGEGRSGDGAPSSTDFLLYDLATVRDKLAYDFEGCTLPVLPGGQARVYVGIGVLVGGFALYAILAEDGCVEVIDIEL